MKIDILEEEKIEFSEKEDILKALTFLLEEINNISIISIRNGTIKEGDTEKELSFFTIIKSGCVEVDE